MGGGSQSKQIDNISSHLMPLYYTKEPVTERDIELCNGTWSAILSDDVPKYKKLLDEPGFDFNSCRIYFYTVFYNRLMELQPGTKGAFRNGIDTVGSFMTKMMSVSLTQLDNQQSFHEAMRGLALRHSQRGIQSYEYFPFGDVLFHALEETLGNLYTMDVDRAWKNVYSSMLTIIIPVTIDFGLKLANRGETAADIKRKILVSNSMSFSEADRTGESAAVPQDAAGGDSK